MSALDAAKTKVLKIIDENPVVVFSKSYCPYCRATKSLLTENNAKFFALELDQVDDCSDIQEALKELTKQTTVPNIYINKNHIGGNSDLQSKRPQLKEMLIQAGAV
ncbi:glutaredoxin domain-containing protein [Terfezia boudieri ATCC MYA-4762]|uniref:Glutaredoxin domain-containing protein n=1 Tax=Terfezia boudieri ATCC MYA-4762 TaxID=1051890 RepID=A0A3N4LLP7_9PEZI|nr:glutaredoxin domain-containing protein [Terfezia boudieri ATCC MYA-4762]